MSWADDYLHYTLTRSIDRYKTCDQNDLLITDKTTSGHIDRIQHFQRLDDTRNHIFWYSSSLILITTIVWQTSMIFINNQLLF